MIDLVGGLAVGLVVPTAFAVYFHRREGSPNPAAGGASESGELTAQDGDRPTHDDRPRIGFTGHGKPVGVRRWLTTVDHKDLGLLYICFGTVAALWGGTDAMMMRTELLTPAVDVWNLQTYNALFTTHGLTMLFFFVTPVFIGLGNYFMPLLIGADDLAFPRVNAVGFWLLPPSLFMLRGGLITEVVGKVLSPLGVGPLNLLFSLEPIDVGWTLYTPLSLQSGNPQVDVALLGLHLSGIATTLAGINFIITAFTERAPDVGWDDIDLFSWNLVVTSALIVIAFPLLGSAVIMLLLDRNFGTAFFVGEGGAMLWQHLFWFFGHPEVYILVLPAFGLVSLILPKFAGRKLFGYRFIVYSTVAIAVLSFGVWAHHMFATGMDLRLKTSFMIVSIAIAVPSAVKEFNWIATLWNGQVRLTAPMLCVLGSLSTFVFGGITGVFLASIPVDMLLHGTYYIVGHFHLIIVGVIPLSMFAASYYWFPIFTGRMYHQRFAMVQAGTAVLGTFLTFLPLLVLGYAGLPRRSGNYPAALAPLQQTASVGAMVLAVAVVLWVVVMIQSARIGRRITDPDPWNLKATDQFTKEWQWFEERLEDQSNSDGATNAG